MSRRRTRVNELTTIYWRDIPAQVTATHSGQTFKALLSPRFQVAIDRAATVAGLTETSAYVAQWRRESHPLDANASGEQRVQEQAAQLESSHDRETLEALVAAGGIDPTQDRTPGQPAASCRRSPSNHQPPSQDESK
ncbi:MAG: virulence factor [Acidimicrobiia bacterium]|nr:virulence factor [Acidimicrobiia bacterium]